MAKKPTKKKKTKSKYHKKFAPPANASFDDLLKATFPPHKKTK